MVAAHDTAGTSAASEAWALMFELITSPSSASWRSPRSRALAAAVLRAQATSTDQADERARGSPALRQLERHRDRRPAREARPRRAPLRRARPPGEDADASPRAASAVRAELIARMAEPPERSPGSRPRTSERCATSCGARSPEESESAPQSVRSGLAGRLPGGGDALGLPGVADRRGAQPEVGGRLLLGRPRVGERRVGAEVDGLRAVATCAALPRPSASTRFA